jgi:hypothetical protein
MWRILVVLTVLATLVVNGLANALPINGQTTAEISDRFEVLFTPAGYVFAIWGLIYIGLAALAVFQALPAQRDNPRLGRARGWIVLSGLANIAWILLWHYERYPLTLLAMLTILGSLIAAYISLEIGTEQVSRGERWFVQIPFSIYLGWISVATIANTTVLLDYLSWAGWGVGPEVWTGLMVAAALLIGWLMAYRRTDWAFPLVLVWAFIGIGVQNSTTQEIAYTAWIAAGLALISAGLAAYRSQTSRKFSNVSDSPA